MRIFEMHKDGQVVGEGVQFTNGRCVLASPRETSMTLYENVEQLEAANDKSTIVWLKEQLPSYYAQRVNELETLLAGLREVQTKRINESVGDSDCG
jgi:hypothetical protein